VLSGVMTADEPTLLLRSVFRRGTEMVTCAVKAINHESAYEVRIVPQSGRAADIVERFSASTRAVVRHAEIAVQLRESGWVSEYGTN